MRISDWSSDVGSSDLAGLPEGYLAVEQGDRAGDRRRADPRHVRGTLFQRLRGTGRVAPDRCRLRHDLRVESVFHLRAVSAVLHSADGRSRAYRRRHRRTAPGLAGRLTPTRPNLTAPFPQTG